MDLSYHVIIPFFMDTEVVFSSQSNPQSFFLKAQFYEPRTLGNTAFLHFLHDKLTLSLPSHLARRERSANVSLVHLFSLGFGYSLQIFQMLDDMLITKKRSYLSVKCFCSMGFSRRVHCLMPVVLPESVWCLETTLYSVK